LPMTYFRFECTLIVKEDCAGVVLDRCTAILQNLTSDDLLTCILPTYDFSNATTQAAVTAGQQTDLIDWLCVTPPGDSWSMIFDGVADYVTMHNPIEYTAFDWDKPWSFTTSVKVDDIGGTYAIVGKRLTTSKGFLFLYVPGGLRLIMRDTLTTGLLTESTVPLVNNTWAKVGFSYDGSKSASGVTIYFNGLPVANVPTSDTLGGSILTAADLMLGKSLGFELDGSLGYTRLWDIELTAAEMLTDYNVAIMPENPIRESNLIVGWKSGQDAYFGNNTFLFPDETETNINPYIYSNTMPYSARSTNVPT
jgi:hypothetical protein